MTFIFVWYAIGAAYQASNLAGLLFYTILLLIISPLLSLFSLITFIVGGISLFMVIMFLIRAWNMSVDLKKWTDIYHLYVTITSTITIALLIFLLNLFSSEITEANPTRLLFFLMIIYAFSLIVNIGFWIGIRMHLGRLEREGKATFNPGLFNSKNHSNN